VGEPNHKPKPVEERVAEILMGPPKEIYDAAKVVKGRWRDVVTRRRPDGTEEVIEETPWRKNTIVQGMPKVLAGLMRNEPTYNGGILYHAMGRGNPAWDPLPTPPTPVYSTVQLVDEYFRKAPTSISYLDPLGNPSPVITGSILVQTVLDYPEANGMAGEYIREQGLFCATATGTLNSGILASVIFHVARWKDASTKLTRYWNIIF
jgi:hypothetical protein